VVTGGSGSTIVEDTELMSISVPQETGMTITNGTNTMFTMSPTYSFMWPKLSQKALTYSRYVVDRLQITYNPAAGTQYNGTLVLAWTPDVQIDPSLMATMNDFMSLPLHVEGTLSSSFSMAVPPNLFTEATRTGLIRDFTQSQNSTTPLYSPGSFFVSAFNTAAGTQMGTLSVSYRITLRQPMNDLAPSTTALHFQATAGVTDMAAVMRAGKVAATIYVADTSFRLAPGKHQLLIQKNDYVAGTQVAPYVNGAPITALVGVVRNATTEISVWSLPATPGLCVLSPHISGAWQGSCDWLLCEGSRTAAFA